jgi:hypothetical protein
VSTVRTYTALLKQLAQSIGKIAAIQNLHHDVPRAKEPRPRTKIATPEQISALLANARPWMRVFITIATADANPPLAWRVP